MAVQLNHTIVHVKDAAASARFVAEILGFPPPRRLGPFTVVDTANGVSLDYISTDEPFLIGHYAFLLTEPEFDQVFDRIKDRRLDYWADPHGRQPNEINHNDGGRGVYFRDPSGHYLEIITRPYGG